MLTLQNKLWKEFYSGLNLKELHPVEQDDGQFKLLVVSWTLKGEEKCALIFFLQ